MPWTPRVQFLAGHLLPFAKTARRALPSDRTKAVRKQSSPRVPSRGPLQPAAPASRLQKYPVENTNSAAEFSSRCFLSRLFLNVVHDLVIRESPSTRASICVRKKQSMASAGLHTIGSLSLNEVFRSTGTPVCRSTSLSSLQ